LIPDNVSFIVCDTETTGAKDTDVPCEVGWVRIDQDFNILEQVESIIDPQQIIAPSASGIHGLTNDMCEAYPTLHEFFNEQMSGCYGRSIDEPVVLIGHRVGFDHGHLKGYITNVVQELDTLRWVRRLYPDSDDHKLSTMIYALGLPISAGAHRVMADVLTAMHLAKHLCERTGMTLRQLAEASAEPFTVKYMPMGKHKGVPIDEIDRGYLRWMLANMDLDPDLKFSVETALENKKKKKYEQSAGADA
jgi:DNA polymerase III epsilon subunit-like protein